MGLSANAYNARQLATGMLTSGDITRMARVAQEHLGLVVDGKAGPATTAALMAAERHEKGTPPDQRDDPWGPFDGPLPFIPRTKREIYDLLGNPGTPEHPREEWETHLVHTSTLPGYRRQVNIHRLVEPYAREGLRRASVVATDKLESVGCWNLRHIRNDTDRPLSLHSWAMACDINPDDNGTATYTRGACPVPWSPEWLARWPNGLSRSFVEAMESVGWVWGGVWGAAGGDFAERAKHVTFADPMHFQLRRPL